MPLPLQLVDNNHVDWGEMAVGTLPGVLVNGGLALLHNNSTQGAGALAATAGGAAALGAAQATPLLSQGVTAAESVLGVMPNQFVTMLMRGPTYKRHVFNWELSPTNADESNTLNQITTVFKNAMSPSFMQVASNIPGPVLWAFPCIFRVAIYPNSGATYKFKPMVLESFVTNLTPGGRAAFYVNETGVEGANYPEGMQIQARFIELEYWTSGNFSAQGSLTTPSNDPADVNNSLSTTIANAFGQVVSAVSQQMQRLTGSQ